VTVSFDGGERGWRGLFGWCCWGGGGAAGDSPAAVTQIFRRRPPDDQPARAGCPEADLDACSDRLRATLSLFRIG